MSRDLACRIALEAEHLTKVEQQRQVEGSSGKLLISTIWDQGESFSIYWSVHKDKAGKVRMSYREDDFEFPHTPDLTKYIVENFYARRKEYAEQEVEAEVDYRIMKAPVMISLTFNRLNSVPLRVESNLPELPAKLDLILRVYASGIHCKH